MATRLNKRFIFILTTVIVLLGLGVGGVAFIAITGDAGRQVKLAQQLEAEGNYVDATDRYGRAITKDPTNLEYYDLFEQSLLKIVPESRAESRDRYNQFLALLGRRKNVSVDNPESWGRLVTEFTRRAEVLGPGSGDVWADVQDQAERMNEEFSGSDDPAAVAATRMALAYEIYAMSNRLDILKPDEERRYDEITDQLIESGSDDPLFWEAVLRRRFDAASRHFAKGDLRLVDRELTGQGGFDEYRGILLDSDTELSPALISLLARRYAFDPPEVRDEATAMAYYDQLLEETRSTAEEIVAADPDLDRRDLEDHLRRCVLAGLLRIEDLTLIAETLLDDERLSLDLALLFFQNLAQADPELALRTARYALEIEPRTVGLMSILQSVVRQQAAIAVFDSIYAQLAGRDEGVTISNLRAAREEAMLEFQGDPALEDIALYMDASISLMENDANVATTKFAELSTRPLVQSPTMRRRYVPRMVAALLMAGERGVAIQKLRDYASGLPASVVTGIRVAIARELLGLGRFEEARGELEKVLAVEPGNAEALLLVEEIATRGDQLQDNPVGGSTPESRAFARATAALAEGRPEDSREVLLSAINSFDENESFRRMLVTVNIMLDRTEEARELIEGIPGYEEDDVLQRQTIILDYEDPIERSMALAEFGYDDEASRNAMKFVYLETIVRQEDEGYDRALEEMPAAFEAAIQELPENRGMVQRFIVSAVRMDRVNGTTAGPDSLAARALAAFEAVEEDEVQLRNTRARIKSALGDDRGALEELQPILDRGIGNAESWFYYGFILESLGRVQEASEAYAKAVERAPDNWRYVLAYSRSLEAIGELEKSLNLLRASRRSATLALLIRDQWLSAESRYGDQKAALNQRAMIYTADMEDASGPEDVIDTANALEFARLLILVPVDRMDIRSGGKPRFSPTSWDSMEPARRRSIIAEEREARRELAFKVIDEVASRTGSEQEAASVSMIKAQAHAIADEPDALEAEIRAVVECCDDILDIEQRYRLIEMLGLIDDEEARDLQFDRLAETDDPDQLRRLVVVLNENGRQERAAEIASRISSESDSIRDRLLLVTSLLASGRAEDAGAILTELEVEEGLQGDNDTRYQFHLLDSQFQGQMARDLMEEALVLDRREAQLRRDGNLAEAVRLSEEAAGIREDATNKVNRGLKAVELAREIAPGQVLPLLRNHELLRARSLLVGGSASEAAILENARTVRDIAPIDWRANRCLMEAHLMMGNPAEALSSLDQFFRRGGTDGDARVALMSLARVQGKPGLAIPALQRAMDREPNNSEWPKGIAQLLVETGDASAAAEMWWKVLEIDPNSGSISEYVFIEFNKDEPNLDRIGEALELDPDLLDARPELRAAYAALLSRSGDARRAERAFAMAYQAARDQLDSGGSRIAFDRMMNYLKRFENTPDREDIEAYLQEAGGMPIGPQELAFIAEQYAVEGMSGESGAMALKYLGRAIDLCSEEDPYRLRLLNSHATLLYLNDDCTGAIKDLREMVELGSVSPDILNNLAYMLLECEGEPDEALYFSTQAIARAPSSAQFLDTHGTVLLALGDYDEAETCLSRAVEIGANPTNLTHYAELLLKTGRSNEAKIIIEKIGKDYPSLTEKQQQAVNELISQLG